MEKPKQTKITDVEPLSGAMNFMSALASSIGKMGKFDNVRGEALTDRFNSITVDTCCPADTSIWETGVEREKIEGKWIIVSQYHSEEEAKAGHVKWVAFMKENPDCELKDIDQWNLNQE